jgi:hypothetical protein
LLQQLAASTESFIPTTFLLLGVLDSKEIRLKPLRDDGKGKQKSKTAVRGIRLPLILKLPKEGTLRTVEQLDAVILQRLRKVSAIIMTVAWCQDLFAH